MTGPRSVILIGLSGAGKSTVAQCVGELLAVPWCDLDRMIESEAGKTITAIFADAGEAHFRKLEHAAMLRTLNEAPQVIAAGAGWAAQPGQLEEVLGLAFVVHLSVDPAVAARRLARADDRPLLQGDLETALRAQLAERGPWYQRADIEIVADLGAPAVVAAGVATAARQYGGWASH